MGAEYKKLTTIEYVTDHDCGMYRMGEIDGLFQDDSLTDFLQRYGAEGRNDLLLHLSFMQAQVVSAFRKVDTDRQIAEFDSATVERPS